MPNADARITAIVMMKMLMKDSYFKGFQSRSFSSLFNIWHITNFIRLLKSM